MSLYCYLKAEPKVPSQIRRNLNKKMRWLKFLPGFLLVAGLILLGNVGFPILFYHLKSRLSFSPQLLVPISETNAQVLGEEVVIDYSRPSNWFPSAPKLPIRPSKITHYTLSIPKLKIKDAVVEIGGEDLTESMIQYPGTSPPGKPGGPAIFCHSALPQLSSTTDYRTICSTLPKIEEEDEILVNYDGILYRYQVIKVIETDPTDVSILAQYFDRAYLTLITCVPPGTYWKRLAVRAKLVR